MRELRHENRWLQAKCERFSEDQIKFEKKMKEQNLIFDGVSETYGETPGLLHKKIVSVLDHMMVFGGKGCTVPFGKIQRLGPFIRGSCRPIVSFQQIL